MSDTDTQKALALDGAKAGGAWLAAVGLGSWSDLAAMLAAFYSLLLIVEWFWKRVARPAAENRGLVKRKARRAEDVDGR